MKRHGAGRRQQHADLALRAICWLLVVITVAVFVIRLTDSIPS